MGVSPMASVSGPVCRGTGAVRALAGLSKPSASCFRAGSGAVLALAIGAGVSSDSEGG